MTMEYRQLGRSGLMVPALSLGNIECPHSSFFCRMSMGPELHIMGF
jgi:hypothetical protein